MNEISCVALIMCISIQSSTGWQHRRRAGILASDWGGEGSVDMTNFGERKD
jgi:hypothetical protein